MTTLTAILSVNVWKFILEIGRGPLTSSRADLFLSQNLYYFAGQFANAERLLNKAVTAAF